MPAAAKQTLDRAAFLAALATTAQVQVKPITLPGVGACYRRALTAGDVLDAGDAVQALVAKGLPDGRKLNAAVGLAQTLCDATGTPLLDPQDPAHIALLLAQPWHVLKAALQADQPDAEGADPNA